MWYRNHLIFTAKVTAKLVIVGERIVYAVINHLIHSNYLFFVYDFELSTNRGAKKC